MGPKNPNKTDQKIEISTRPKEKYNLRIKTNAGTKAGLHFSSKEWYLAAYRTSLKRVIHFIQNPINNRKKKLH